jgi:hypothetical protein
MYRVGYYKGCKNWGSKADSSKTTSQETIFIACKWSATLLLELTKYYFVFFIYIYPVMCKGTIITPFKFYLLLDNSREILCYNSGGGKQSTF